MNLADTINLYDVNEFQYFLESFAEVHFKHHDLPNHLQELRREAVFVVGHDNLYYSLFYELSRTHHPTVVVELGTWRGIGAAHFAAGCKTTKVLAVDIHKDDKYAQQRTIDIARIYPNMIYINKWTWDAVVDVKPYVPIDILFIDAWHEYQYAMREWKLYEPLLADTALVICDDIFDSKGATVDMIKFWDEVSNHKNAAWSLLDTSLHSGIPMGFMLYER